MVLRRSDLVDDPFEQFQLWFTYAGRAGEAEPEAMALATSTPDGRSSVRFVLLRGIDERGFVFYTNGRSRKGDEIESNPWASAAFRWHTVDRQVRVAGPVQRIPDEESDGYFASRPPGSQIGAWASDQSHPVPDEDELDRRVREAEQRFGDGPVPRPPWWGGYRITPVEVEFWQQGQFRLHDRFRYCRQEDGRWVVERLFP